MKDRKAIHLGYFHDEKEAAKAYKDKAIELFGEFACLNDVSDDETPYLWAETIIHLKVYMA